MTSSALLDRPTPKDRGARRSSERPRLSGRRQVAAGGSRRGRLPVGGRRLDSYLDVTGRMREVVVSPGSGGSILVLDRDATTFDDRRVVAHLAPDEPDENAAIVCSDYLRQGRHRRCRPLRSEDLSAAPFAGCPELEPPTAADTSARLSRQLDSGEIGLDFRLERLSTGMSIPELRWCGRTDSSDDRGPRAVSTREVVACLESYEPVCARTSQALRDYDADETVSTAVLRIELMRVRESPIVLNRGLREAALEVIARQGLSMSEIAMRCGRVKRDRTGNASGETSWLARRLGLLPEGGRHTPTPWVHSDVLALIARDGLGVSPREVEVN
jgi:hypothetical protein